jgi:putative copper resistance protein D
LILARTDAFDADGRSAAAAYLAGGAMIVCALFLIATVAKLYLQSRVMAGQLSASPTPVHALLMDTGWGRVWRLQFAAGILALFGLVAARRRLHGGWAVAAFAAILIAAGAALSGHAGVAERFRAFAVLDDAVHVVGAAGWLGSLFWVVVMGTIFPLDAGEGAARRLANLVSAFSPVALWCSALVALSGVASGWLRLGSISALWTSSYGAVLLLKLALVAVAAGIGFYNWRRIRPVLGTDVATARLRRSATMELTVGGAIVLVTAVLVGLPTPVPGVR